MSGDSNLAMFSSESLRVMTIFLGMLGGEG